MNIFDNGDENPPVDGDGDGDEFEDCTGQA